jgi:hypothetical protein
VMVIVLPRAMSSMVNSERIISPEPLRWIRHAPSAARLRPATERTRPRRSERHGSTATHATTVLTSRVGQCVPVVRATAARTRRRQFLGIHGHGFYCRGPSFPNPGDATRHSCTAA